MTDDAPSDPKTLTPEQKDRLRDVVHARGRADVASALYGLRCRELLEAVKPGKYYVSEHHPDDRVTITVVTVDPEVIEDAPAYRNVSIERFDVGVEIKPEDDDECPD